MYDWLYRRRQGWYISAGLEQAMHKNFLGVKGMTLMGRVGSNSNGSPPIPRRNQYPSSSEETYLLET